MNTLYELHQRLSSKTRIRALFKDVSVQDLEKILGRLRGIHGEKLKARSARDERRLKKLDKIKAIQKEMVSLGLTMSDLDELDEDKPAGKKHRNVTKHTFEFESPTGDRVRWYGATTGRLPLDFQGYLEKKEKKRIDCIVDTDR